MARENERKKSAVEPRDRTFLRGADSGGRTRGRRAARTQAPVGEPSSLGVREIRSRATVAHIVAAMEQIAPTALAQEWDNVGLLAGDMYAPVRRVLLAIDLTEPVLREARKGKHDLILAYHPPIFKPISALRVPSSDPSGFVFECVRNGISVYSTHTALDAADGGTNDVLAELCGAKRTDPIKYVDQGGSPKCKFVVFVPAAHVERVAEALFLAGAGRIGNYTHCSYRLSGEGTFFGSESTNPAVGSRGQVEHVSEIRLETVVPEHGLAGVIEAMRRTHPYEEPAFDIYPLAPSKVKGIGRVGTLPAATTLSALAKRLARATKAATTQVVGDLQRDVDRVIVLAGSAGSIPFSLDLTPRDVIITGEMRHHDALTVQRRGCSAIALGHWASERPVLSALLNRLTAALPGVTASISSADADPFLGL